MSLHAKSPIDLFESLAIDTQMSSTNVDFGTRIVEVRDVLSSFDREVLPSEFKLRIFEQLDRPSQSRPPVSQWTIQEDLPATLLQWGAYDDQAYELLTKLQSSSTLVRCFYEKVQRRFESLFYEYDYLREGNNGPIRAGVQRIANGFRRVVVAVGEDRQHRRTGQAAIAQRLLEALAGVCRRHVDLIPASQSPVNPRRGTRPSGSLREGPMNLYEALIKNPSEDENNGPFMLDVLETFPGSTFTSLHSEHSSLVSLLDINGAPSAYRYRVGRLPSGTDSGPSQAGGTQRYPESTSGLAVPTLPAEPPESIAPPLQTQIRQAGQALPRMPTQSPAEGPSATGSKRSADDSSTASKRGKKKNR